MEMNLVNRWPNQKALLSKIGTKTPPCYFARRWVNLLGPCLDRQHGFELHNRKMRDPRARTRLLKKTIYEVGAVLFVVSLG
jgi:hypothetical protein